MRWTVVMVNTRCLVEVTAGVIPGTPEPELTRQFVMEEPEWEANNVNALTDVVGQAQGYATWLMLQPERNNWVNVQWIWL